MPAAVAYRRAPLMDPAYVPLGDAAVHTAGLQQELTDRVLAMVDVDRMNALDAVLATKLGGYTQAPPMPDLRDAETLLPGRGMAFAQNVRAAAMIASMNRDREGMLSALEAMRALLAMLPIMTEEQLFRIGADVLRVAVDLYRRPGQRFLLTLMENLRSRLPDVSGLMHMFPFQTEYQPEIGAAAKGDPGYFDRMERFANGKLMADSVAMTALISQYSGSGRDAAAAKAGLTALKRYHGMASGVFAADPSLAGRDPSRAADLETVCAQAEALLDALASSGDLMMAEQLEMLLVNVLPDLITPKGLRTMSPVNRLADDDSCAVSRPEPAEVSALLRALYAVRRAVWMNADDQTIAYLLPVSGGCRTRLNGVPVRLTAEVRGVLRQEIAIRFECREPVSCTLKVRIPGYTDNARLSVNGEKPQPAAKGQLAEIRRTFRNGDMIMLQLDLSPRIENGHRGSVSIYAGARLMALALPEKGMDWRYALLRSAAPAGTEDGGVPYALVAACEAIGWEQRNGFILPPPQGVQMSDAYELTLMPFAGTSGRIAAFPCVQER